MPAAACRFANHPATVAEISVADFTMMVRGPGQPTAVFYTDDRDEAQRFLGPDHLTTEGGRPTAEPSPTEDVMWLQSTSPRRWRHRRSVSVVARRQGGPNEPAHRRTSGAQHHQHGPKPVPPAPSVTTTPTIDTRVTGVGGPRWRTSPVEFLSEHPGGGSDPTPAEIPPRPPPPRRPAYAATGCSRRGASERAPAGNAFEPSNSTDLQEHH